MKQVISILLLAFAILSHASEKDELKKFLQNKELMPSSGKFAGQYIEGKEKRTIMYLSPAQKRVFGIDTQDLAFANFRHNGKFYIATIPSIKVNSRNELLRASSVIKDVTFVKEHWAGKTRPQTASMEVHAELIFNFKNTSGIFLIYNQSDEQYLSASKRIGGALISIEAIRSEKEPNADFLPLGAGYNFAVGHRFYSLGERELKYRKETAATFTEYPLDFSNTRSYSSKANAMDNLLFTSLSTSNYWGRNQTYNLMNNNCTNRMFDLLDQAMGYNQRNGGRVNFRALEANYVEWVNNDLKDVIGFIEDYAKLKGIVLPQEIKNLIDSSASNMALGTISQMRDNWGENDPKNFLYQLPMFIEGHLKARGLIR